MADFVPGKFDCLITDLSMPGYSGLDLLRRLRSIGSSIPVIIVTADASSATRSRAAQEGAHAYFTKPVCSNELLRELQVVLDRTSDSARGRPETRSDG